MFFKSNVGVLLSNCLNIKKKKKKKIFGMRNTQHSIELSVHKQVHSIQHTRYKVV